MNRAAAGAPRLALLTPEHVAIDFRIADLGTRATAVVLDVGIQIAVMVVLGMLFSSPLRVGDDVLPALLLVAAFVVRNFYFTFTELHWQGRTPGKRALGLRVVARDGGPLTAEMLFARNLTRELETFLPLSALLAPDSLVPGAPWWVQLVTVVWILALTLLPLFNRQRARLGDLLAGTVVVFEPRTALDSDLVEEAHSFGAQQEYAFTAEQLDVYGIRELQVLEDVLRRPPSDQRDDLLRLISDKVRHKIDWDSSGGNTSASDTADGDVHPQRFLQAFYAAQRGRLERHMLFGQRRERKVR